MGGCGTRESGGTARARPKAGSRSATAAEHKAFRKEIRPADAWAYADAWGPRASRQRCWVPPMPPALAPARRPEEERNRNGRRDARSGGQRPRSEWARGRRAAAPGGASMPPHLAEEVCAPITVARRGASMYHNLRRRCVHLSQTNYGCIDLFESWVCAPLAKIGFRRR